MEGTKKNTTTTDVATWAHVVMEEQLLPLQTAEPEPQPEPRGAPEPAVTRNPSKHARLQALDLVRGFTVWLMIFVDDVSCGVVDEERDVRAQGGALRAARRRHDLLRDARCPLREELDESALG